jgi:hypothetical protein
VQRYMVGVDGVRPGSVVASESGLMLLAQLEGPSVESFHHIVHLRVDRIFGLGGENFLCGSPWCRGHSVRDCRMVHHYWHLCKQNSSCD